MKGVKISKKRTNVNRATASELVVDSTAAGSFKIYSNINITVITTWVVGDQQDITIAHPHGLDYVPAYSATVYLGNTQVSQTVPLRSINGAGDSEVLNAYVDNKNVYVSVKATTSRTFIFHIAIFEERLDV